MLNPISTNTEDGLQLTGGGRTIVRVDTGEVVATIHAADQLGIYGGTFVMANDMVATLAAVRAWIDAGAKPDSELAGIRDRIETIFKMTMNGGRMPAGRRAA